MKSYIFELVIVFMLEPVSQCLTEVQYLFLLLLLFFIAQPRDNYLHCLTLLSTRQNT